MDMHKRIDSWKSSRNRVRQNARRVGVNNGSNTVSLLISTNGTYSKHPRFKMHQPFTGRFVGSPNGAVWEDTANLIGADIALVDPLPFRPISDYHGWRNPNGAVPVPHRHVSTRRCRQLPLVQPCHAGNNLRGRVQRTPRG